MRYTVASYVIVGNLRLQGAKGQAMDARLATEFQF